MTPLQSQRHWQLMLQQDIEIRQPIIEVNKPNNDQALSGLALTAQKIKLQGHSELDGPPVAFVHLQNKPKLQSTPVMTPQQESLLFKQHRLLGNRWQQIAQAVGTEDHNTVKNKFYSTLRKGIRKFNRFIYLTRKQTPRSQQHLFKQLKPDFITKLTAIADKHYQEKYEVRQPAIDSASVIQQKMIELARSEQEFQENWEDQKEDLAEMHAQVQVFNKNCKRRKGKYRKRDQKSENSESEHEEVEQKLPSKVEEKKQTERKGLGKGKGKEAARTKFIEKPASKPQEEQMHPEAPIKGKGKEINLEAPAKGKGKELSPVKGQGKGIRSKRSREVEGPQLSEIMESEQMGELINPFEVDLGIVDPPINFDHNRNGQTPSRTTPRTRSIDGILMASSEIANKNMGFASAVDKNPQKFRSMKMSGSMSVGRRDSDPLRMNMVEGSSFRVKPMSKIIESKDISGESLLTNTKPRQQLDIKEGESFLYSMIRRVSHRQSSQGRE